MALNVWSSRLQIGVTMTSSKVQCRMTSNLWSSFLILFSICLAGRTPVACRSTLTLTLFTRRPAVLMLLPLSPHELPTPRSRKESHSRVQLVGISPHFILQYIHISSCISKVTRSRPVSTSGNKIIQWLWLQKQGVVCRSPPSLHTCRWQSTTKQHL